jgi:hypothetical protein
MPHCEAVTRIYLAYFFFGAAFFAFAAVLGLVLLPHPHPAILLTS